jgi:hypothetical protein
MAEKELMVRIGALYVESLDQKGESITRHRRGFGNTRTDAIKWLAIILEANFHKVLARLLPQVHPHLILNHGDLWRIYVIQMIGFAHLELEQSLSFGAEN